MAVGRTAVTAVWLTSKKNAPHIAENGRGLQQISMDRKGLHAHSLRALEAHPDVGAHDKLLLALINQVDLYGDSILLI